MKILYSVNGYKPAYRLGGPIHSVSAAAEALVARGHEVTVFTSNSNLDEDLDVPVNQPLMVEGVEVWYFKRRNPLAKYPLIRKAINFANYIYTPEIRNALDEKIESFDLVHTHIPFIYPTYATARAALKYGKPLAYSQRAAFAPGYLKFRKLKKLLYIYAFEYSNMKNAEVLIALNDAEIDSYRTLGIKTNIEVVPNGIHADDYLQETRLDIEPLGIQANHLVLLFLARFHLIKGADFLINVFIQIASQFPNAILVMAGPDEHGHTKNFQDKLKSAGIASQVRLPGMVTGETKKEVLARADIFCLPSAAEGFSMAILEALASGTPVIMTPECNFPMIEVYDAGWIVDRDMKPWTELLHTILRDPEQLTLKGKNALALVKMHYTWDKVVDKLERIYQGVVGRSRTK